jgi:FtsP/CotA-like multicopper oxidase with cupredoxin domain
VLHNGSVPGRSILLFVAALLLIAALASVIAPRQRTVVGPSTTQPPQLAAPSPAARTITGSLPADARIDATVGDIVQLTVTADHPDEAQIFDLGLDAPVDFDLPGVLEFVADQPGRFAVTLRYSGERVGVLVVRSAS